MVDLIESVRNLGIGQSEEAGEQLPEVNGTSGNHAEEEEEEDTLEQVSVAGFGTEYITIVRRA